MTLRGAVQARSARLCADIFAMVTVATPRRMPELSNTQASCTTRARARAMHYTQQHRCGDASHRGVVLMSLNLFPMWMQLHGAFWRRLGSLVWLLVPRAGIAPLVGCLQGVAHAPLANHVTLANRAVRYSRRAQAFPPV